MALILAMLLDALLGEPRWLWQRLPHPAVLMGRVIAAADRRFNSGSHRRFRGALVIIGLAFAAFALGVALTALPGGPVIETIIAAILLAHRSLVDHVRAVARALEQSIDAARREVAKIVGRDTAHMDETQVARAAIESAAENFSDGVIAPAFWFLVAGLPGMLVYKLINTADSMIGYRTPKHLEFGWAAARADDVANWIPARLTALVFILSHWRWDAVRYVLRDAPRHRSVNAGWPEAAMAVCLGVALAGPRSYEGETMDFPFVYPEGRHVLTPDDVRRAVGALWRAWGVFLILACALVVV